MPDPAATVDLIDHAIRDWETSPDAVRWGPDIKPDDRRLGHLCSDDVYDALRQMTENFRTALGAYFQDVAATWERLAAVLEPLVADEVAHNKDAQARPSWHKRRCTRCNPLCAITPAWSYGREYHKRLRARARRRRR